MRSLEKSGQRYAFGSYKYTALVLYDRGVLLSIEEFSPRQFGLINIVISSDEVGVFEFRFEFNGVEIQAGKAELELQELLEAQFVSRAKRLISVEFMC